MKIFGTTTIPERAVAVKPFNKNKYMGKWYEIARLDFRFERNMCNVTASYSINGDGTVRVENKGYNCKKNIWKKAIGKARFVKRSDEAKLEVSFFGPFYSGYNVIAIDPEYKYSLVAGKNLRYLWLLSRETTMPEDIKQSYLKIAEQAGYDTSALIWTEQET